jgi:hypothetical protein
VSFPREFLAIAKLLWLYLSLRICLVANREHFVAIFQRAIIVSLIFLLCLGLYLMFVYNIPLTRLFMPNNSIFAILVSAQLASFVFFIKKETFKSSVHKIGVGILLVAVLFALVILGGRSACVALLATLTFIYIPTGKASKKYVAVAIVSILIVVSISFALKYNSSLGRLLIYKVSFKMLEDNWLLGIGHNQFVNKYLQYQADYFNVNGTNNPAAMLADNTMYAFNDLLQACIEHGVVVIAFCASVLFMNYKKLFHFNRDILDPAHIILLIVGIASMFSYPFHYFPIVICAFCAVPGLGSIQRPLVNSALNL